MLTTLLPAGDTEFVVQDRQVTFDVAAVVVEYRFTGQSVQTNAPVCALCLPAWHALHGRPSCPVTCE